MKNQRKIQFAGAFAALALTAVNHAGAQNLPAPVSGLQILDLAGTVQRPTATYTTSFVATSADSTITFVFRHDPGFFTLQNVNVQDAGAGPNLLLNGDFSVNAPTAPGAGVPDWTYFIQAGNVFPQFLGYELDPTSPNSPGGGFFDGSTQAYDGIDQTFSTIVGDTYTVSFGLLNDTASTDSRLLYQQTSSNGDTTDTGGNGIDVALYAGNGLPPTTVPDGASTMGLMTLGLAGLGGIARKLRA